RWAERPRPMQSGDLSKAVADGNASLNAEQFQDSESGDCRGDYGGLGGLRSSSVSGGRKKGPRTEFPRLLESARKDSSLEIDRRRLTRKQVADSARILAGAKEYAGAGVESGGDAARYPRSQRGEARFEFACSGRDSRSTNAKRIGRGS